MSRIWWRLGQLLGLRGGRASEQVPFNIVVSGTRLWDRSLVLLLQFRTLPQTVNLLRVLTQSAESKSFSSQQSQKSKQLLFATNTVAKKQLTNSQYSEKKRRRTFYYASNFLGKLSRSPPRFNIGKATINKLAEPRKERTMSNGIH